LSKAGFGSEAKALKLFTNSISWYVYLKMVHLAINLAIKLNYN